MLKSDMQNPTKQLIIYLQDHLAGSVAGIELTKRCLKNNPNHHLGQFLKKFLKELLREQVQLKKTIRILGASPLSLKRVFAWILEKGMRLKLNNTLLEYSNLSRLIELEALLAAVNAKFDMWSILKNLLGKDHRFSLVNFHRLQEQAGTQISQLKKECLKAGKVAFRGL